MIEAGWSLWGDRETYKHKKGMQMVKSSGKF